MHANFVLCVFLDHQQAITPFIYTNIKYRTIRSYNVNSATVCRTFIMKENQSNRTLCVPPMTTTKPYHIVILIEQQKRPHTK